MLNRGKTTYLKKLYPYVWAQVHWMAFRDKILKQTKGPRLSSVLAIMPRDDSSSIIMGTCTGIHPIRSKILKVTK